MDSHEYGKNMLYSRKHKECRRLRREWQNWGRLGRGASKPGPGCKGPNGWGRGDVYGARNQKEIWADKARGETEKGKAWFVGRVLRKIVSEKLKNKDHGKTKALVSHKGGRGERIGLLHKKKV